MGANELAGIDSAEKQEEDDEEEEHDDQKNEELMKYVMNELEALETTPFSLSMREDELESYKMGTRNSDGTYSSPEFRWKRALALFTLHVIAFIIYFHARYGIVDFLEDSITRNPIYRLENTKSCRILGGYFYTTFTVASFIYYVLEIYLLFVVYCIGSLYVERIVTCKFTYKNLIYYAIVRTYPLLFLHVIVFPLVRCRMNDKLVGIDKTIGGLNQDAATLTVVGIIWFFKVYSVVLWTFADIYIYWKASNGNIESKAVWGFQIFILSVSLTLELILDYSCSVSFLSPGQQMGRYHIHPPDEDGYSKCIHPFAWFSEKNMNKVHKGVADGVLKYRESGHGSIDWFLDTRIWCGHNRYDSETGLPKWDGDRAMINSFTYLWDRYDPIVQNYNLKGDLHYSVVKYEFWYEAYVIWCVNVGLIPLMVILAASLRNWRHGSRGQFGDVVIYDEDSNFVQRPREFSQGFFYYFHAYAAFSNLSMFVMPADMIRQLDKCFVVSKMAIEFFLIFYLIWFFLLKLTAFYAIRTSLGRNNYLPLMFIIQFSEAFFMMILTYVRIEAFTMDWIFSMLMFFIIFAVRDTSLQHIIRLLFKRLRWMDDGVLEDLIFDEEVTQYDCQTAFSNICALAFLLMFALVEVFRGSGAVLYVGCSTFPKNACLDSPAVRLGNVVAIALILGGTSAVVIKSNLNRLSKRRSLFIASNYHKKIDHQLTVSWEKAHDWVPRCIYFTTTYKWVMHHCYRTSFIFIFVLGHMYPFYVDLLLQSPWSSLEAINGGFHMKVWNMVMFDNVRNYEALRIDRSELI